MIMIIHHKDKILKAPKIEALDPLIEAKPDLRIIILIEVKIGEAIMEQVTEVEHMAEVPGDGTGAVIITLPILDNNNSKDQTKISTHHEAGRARNSGITGLHTVMRIEEDPIISIHRLRA